MGSVVFFNGYLLHKSLKNRRRDGFRRALVNHYMRAENRCFRGGAQVDLIRRRRICGTSFSLRAPIRTPRKATKT